MLNGDPHTLATNPTIMDGARNAAMNGLRDVYINCGLPEAEADVVVSNAPSDPEAVERLITIAKTEISTAAELKNKIRIARELGPMGEVRGVPLGRVNSRLHQPVSVDEKAHIMRRRLTR